MAPLVVGRHELYFRGVLVALAVGRGGVLLGTVGWSDGSFSLPQDDIDESADQRQGEGHPRQDVGVAK